MKAISVHQPWAHAIIALGKDIENRPWSTMYRGPLLIHASKTMTREDQQEFFALTKDFPSQLRPLQTLPLGGIVGIAELYDVVTDSASPWFAGPFGFPLRHARPVPFIPFRGMLGLFDVPVDIPLLQPEYVH